MDSWMVRIEVLGSSLVSVQGISGSVPIAENRSPSWCGRQHLWGRFLRLFQRDRASLSCSLGLQSQTRVLDLVRVGLRSQQIEGKGPTSNVSLALPRASLFVSFPSPWFLFSLSPSCRAVEGVVWQGRLHGPHTPLDAPFLAVWRR